MKTSLILILLGFVSVVKADAGDGTIVGNGGDAVVCRDSDKNIVSAELLDYFEARVERGVVHELDPSKTRQENLQTLIANLQYHDRYTSQKMSEWLESFEEEANFISGVELEDVKDSHHITVPTGCKVEQVAIQKEPRFPGQKYYTVSNDIWQKLDSANQAGLMMHEVLYRSLVSQSEPNTVNSIAVRYFNSVIAADELSVFTFQEYLEFIRKELKIRRTNVSGFLAVIGTITFTEGEITAFAGEAEQDVVVDITSDFQLTARSGAEFSYQANPDDQTEYIHIIHKNKGELVRINGKELLITEARSKIKVDHGLVVNIEGVGFRYDGPVELTQRFLDCELMSFTKAEVANPDDEVVLDGGYGCAVKDAVDEFYPPLILNSLTDRERKKLPKASSYVFRFDSDDQLVSARSQYGQLHFDFYDTGEVLSMWCGGCKRDTRILIVDNGSRGKGFNLNTYLKQVFKFHKNGVLKSARSRWGFRFALGPYIVQGAGEAIFYPNGLPSYVESLKDVPKNAAAPASDGSYIEIKNDMSVNLDELGRIIL